MDVAGHASSAGHDAFSSGGTFAFTAALQAHPAELAGHPDQLVIGPVHHWHGWLVHWLEDGCALRKSSDQSVGYADRELAVAGDFHVWLFSIGVLFVA